MQFDVINFLYEGGSVIIICTLNWQECACVVVGTCSKTYLCNTDGWIHFFMYKRIYVIT